MRRLSWAMPVGALLAVLLIPSNIFSCANPVETRFVSKHFPEAPQPPYIAGKLGVLWPGFERGYLVIAYRYLDHKPLTAEEQQSLDRRLQPNILPPGTTYDSDPPVTAWLKARSYLKFLGIEAKQGRLPEEYLRFDGWPVERLHGWRSKVWVCPGLSASAMCWNHISPCRPFW